MGKACSDFFVAFNGQQQITATSTFAAAASAIRLEMLNTDISDRQAHIIMLLGSREVLMANGVVLDPMTKTRLLDHIMKQFEVRDTTAEADVKRLQESNIITTETDETDGLVRIVVLTEIGKVLYEQLADRMANLILTLAEWIKRDGPVPTEPRSNIRVFVRDFARRIRPIIVAAVATAVALTLAMPDAHGPAMEHFHMPILDVIETVDVRTFHEDGLTVLIPPRA
jgi:DNA-binding MarR family transcriptional regulator